MQTPEPATETPLAEAESIAELMRRDPLSFGKQDIAAIVTFLRKNRAAYVQANNKTIGKPESRKSTTQKKTEAATKAAGNLDLDQLGLL